MAEGAGASGGYEYAYQKNQFTSKDIAGLDKEQRDLIIRNYEVQPYRPGLLDRLPARWLRPDDADMGGCCRRTSRRMRKHKGEKAKRLHRTDRSALSIQASAPRGKSR